MPRTAWIAGASGHVGGKLLDQLLRGAEYGRVVSLVRRQSEVQHPKLEERVVDFDRLADDGIPAADDVYCTLGTTLKKAGSREAFRRVDYGYPLALAEKAAGLGAKRFLLVTSVATDTRSPNYYLRVKGELETAVAALPFESIDYFRPSFLMGERAEPRPAERVGIAFARIFQFLLFGPMRIYRPIEAEQVAAAMVGAALTATPGRRIHHYDDMLALASRAQP